MATDSHEELGVLLAAQDWTAHNVELGDGLTTMRGAPGFFATDMRLAAVRRVLRMRFGDDVSGLRIADLGCLEGGFAAALALDGATVLGLEARPANLAKADLLRRWFGLQRLSLHEGDVKELTREQYGEFDVVLALGILYHLDHPAAWLRQIGAAVRTMLIVDTHVAPPTEALRLAMRPDLRDLSPLEMEIVGRDAYVGRWYDEFDEGISDAARAEQLWASWSNHQSFWLTEESLLRALSHAGFDVVVQQHDATVGDYERFRVEHSRGTYVALKTANLGATP